MNFFNFQKGTAIFIVVSLFLFLFSFTATALSPLNSLTLSSFTWWNPFTWFGEKEISEVLVEYTPTTQKTCRDGVCNVILYSGTRYVLEDDEWKKIEEARSLKNSGIECIIIEDEEHKAKCLDWNYTSISLEFSKEKGGEAPIRLIRNGVEVERENLVFDNSFGGEKKAGVIRFSMGDEIHFGRASTIITLKDMNEITQDTYVAENNPTTNYGNADLLLQARTSNNKHAMIKFDISSLPEGTITKAELGLWLESEGLGTANAFNISVHHYYNQTWLETYPTWNNRPQAGEYNATYTDKLTFTGTSEEEVWYEWDVTNTLLIETQQNISFYLISGEGDSGMTTSWLKFHQRNIAGIDTNPVLNVTYSDVFCEEDLQFTEWSAWEDLDCINTTHRNQSRYKIEYDANNCGTFSNVTHWEYGQVEDESCDVCDEDLQFTEWSAWEDIGCINQTHQNQSRNRIEYDANDCGFENVTHYEYQTVADEDCDTKNPVFSNCRNFNKIVNNSFSESIKATDESGIDSYWLNDTTNFAVDNSGEITNETEMSIVMKYVLNLTANDTTGKQASCIFYINYMEPSVVDCILDTEWLLSRVKRSPWDLGMSENQWDKKRLVCK